MKESALSVANYFVQKSLDENKDLKPLKLMKLVYIAHGFMLAITEKSILNKAFDKVEAWRLGPVIPSVYHSFKIYRDTPIKAPTVVVKSTNDGFSFETPELNDDIARKVCDIVWKRYDGFNDSEMVSMLHQPGTPWAMCYIKNENMPIPDELTRIYYRKLLDLILDKSKNGK